METITENLEKKFHINLDSQPTQKFQNYAFTKALQEICVMTFVTAVTNLWK